MQNKRIPMTFAGGPTYMPQYLKQSLRENLFSEFSYLNINSNNKQFWQIVEKARQNIRNILSIPYDHQIWFLSGGCHLQFAGIPLNFLGQNINTTANYTTTGYFSKLAYNEAKRYCNPKSIMQTKIDQNGQFFIPKTFFYDEQASYTHFIENQSVQGISFKDQQFPVKQGIPLINDCSSSFLTRSINWQINDIVYAHCQKNCGISGLTVMILNEKSFNINNKKILPKICSFQNYRKLGGINCQMNILPIYSHYIITKYVKQNGGLQINNYQKRAEKLYQVIDKYKIYKARVRKEHRSPISVTWNIQNSQILQKCLDAGAQQDLYQFKGHRSIGGLRASLFCPIPDQSVYRLTDFLQEFGQKYQ